MLTEVLAEGEHSLVGGLRPPACRPVAEDYAYRRLKILGSSPGIIRREIVIAMLTYRHT